MSEDGRQPFVIYYIANGQAVSKQNKGRIVGFLADAQREAAKATPDRLSLAAIASRPDNPVVIYALTPATSFPGTRARLTGGGRKNVPFSKCCLKRHILLSLAILIRKYCVSTWEIVGVGRKGRGDQIRITAPRTAPAVSRSAGS